VAGQSTGGNVAVELAYRHPDRVRAVVGVDGGALELQRRWPEWKDCERNLAPPRLEGTRVDELAEMLHRHHPDWGEAGVAATLGNLELLEDGTVRPWLTRERHLRLLRSLWEHRPSRLLPDLQVPLLLVSAENGDDWADTRKEEASAAECAGPHVRVEWVPGDHDLHVQHPEQIARLLLGAVLKADHAP
ncbi:MAG: alpha/beta hydrolase, partial [Actinomycetota bacterium]|nr:alpha/beta hydrolase [Actinomycetota bacterium]